MADYRERRDASLSGDRKAHIQSILRGEIPARKTRKGIPI